MKAHGLDDCDLLVELCSVDEYQILLAVMPKLDLPLCKYCNSSNVKRHGYTTQPRRVAHAPIGAIRVRLICTAHAFTAGIATSSHALSRTEFPPDATKAKICLITS